MKHNSIAGYLLKTLFSLAAFLTQQACAVFRMGEAQTSGLSDWNSDHVKTQSYNHIRDKFLVMSYRNTFKIFSDRNRGESQKYTNPDKVIILSGVTETAPISNPQIFISGDDDEIVVQNGKYDSPTQKITLYDKNGGLKRNFDINFPGVSDFYMIHYFQQNTKPFLFIYQ